VSNVTSQLKKRLWGERCC